MNNYVALVSDQTLRVSWVYLAANSWEDAVKELETTGFEVVEDQTEDFCDVDLSDEAERKDAIISTIEELLPYVILYS